MALLKKKDPKILSFQSAKKFESWLEKHYTKEEGIWLKFFKKNSGIKSVNYKEALDAALCYGWIDGQAKSLDEKSYLQKFTPRRAKSIWSKRNTEHIQRLIKEKRMKPSGLLQVKLAKQDGRWDNAYHSPTTVKMPKDFLEALAKNKKAQIFYDSLNKSNTFAIYFRIISAKKLETREKRIKEIVKQLAQKKKLY